MPIKEAVHGARVGKTLKIDIEVDGVDLTVGDKWTLNCAARTPNVDLTPPEHEVPAGATGTHTLTWKSADVLPAWLAMFAIELRKTHGAGAGLVPVKTFTVNVQPAVATRPAPTQPATGTPNTTAATPLAGTPTVTATVPGTVNVRIVGIGSEKSWFDTLFSLANITLMGSLLALFLVLWIIHSLLVGSGFHYFGTTSPTVPEGQTTVIIGYQVTTDDPTVALEAAGA